MLKFKDNNKIDLNIISDDTFYDIYHTLFPFDYDKSIFSRVMEISQNFICDFVKQQKTLYDEGIDDEDLRKFAERFYKNHKPLSNTLERNLFAIIFSTIKDHNISFIEGWNYSFNDYFTKKDFSQINQKEKRSLSYAKQFEVDTQILVNKIIDAISIEKDAPETLAFKKDLFENLYSELFFKSKALHTYLFDKIEMEVAVDTPESLLKKTFETFDVIDLIHDNFKSISKSVAAKLSPVGDLEPFVVSAIEDKLIKSFCNLYNEYQTALMNEVHFNGINKQKFEKELNDRDIEHLVDKVRLAVSKISYAVIVPLSDECYKKQREYFKEKGYDMDNFDESQWEEFTHITYSRNNAISSMYTAIINTTNEIKEEVRTKEEFAQTREFFEKEEAKLFEPFEENTDGNYNYYSYEQEYDKYEIDFSVDDGDTYYSDLDDEENFDL